jgi:hypothetical protein
MSSFCYARTAEGQAAAYDATSAMPRKLRSLLKVIDGKTSNEVFANSLKAFGDVQGLLASLQKAGLIELRKVADATNEPQPPEATSRFAKKPVAQQAEPDGFAATQAVHTPAMSTVGLKSGAEDLSAQARQDREQDLQLLVHDMSSFVLAYVPQEAFGVLSELEQTTNMEQMAVLLGGYELIVKPVGEPANIHLRHVRVILSKWL